MNFPGSKQSAGVWQRLINLMPPHSVYIEAFLGSGTLMRMKRPARLNIGLDLDPASLKLAVSAEPFRGPHTVKTAMVDAVAAATAIMPRSAALAGKGDARAHFAFFRGDGIEFLERYPFTGDELVYCDPPYLLSTRSRKRIYRYEMSDVAHARFVEAAGKCPAHVMISGYWSKLYAERLAGWRSIKYQVMTRGGLRTEWLWFNFPRPRRLHDYDQVGQDFRSRECIRRKAGRWVAKLGRLPSLERNAMLALIEVLWQPRLGFRRREMIRRKIERLTGGLGRLEELERNAIINALRG